MDSQGHIQMTTIPAIGRGKRKKLFEEKFGKNKYGLLPAVHLIAMSRQATLNRLSIGVARRPNRMRGIDRSEHCAVRRCPEGWKPPRLDADRRSLVHFGSAGSKILFDSLSGQHGVIAAVDNGLGNMT
jgi:hypothetical protein